MNPASCDRAMSKFKSLMEKCRTEQEVGRGGFSSVYMAHFVANPGERIAVKQLHIANQAQTEVLRAQKQKKKQKQEHLEDTPPPPPRRHGVDHSLLWELQCLDCHHPNIIHIDAVTLKVPPSILLYLPFLSCDLHKFIASSLTEQKGTHLGFPQINSIFSQILIGVGFLHRNGIVHRDLKPQNVMINMTKSSYEVKIIDFGWARHYANPLIPMMSEGTPGTIYYRAPEVLMAETVDYGPPFDVWSLGCILFEMVSGALLFHFTPPSEVDRKGPCRGWACAVEYYIAKIGHPGDYAKEFTDTFPTENKEMFDPDSLPATLRDLATTLRRPKTTVHSSCLASVVLWEVMAKMLHWVPSKRATSIEAGEQLKQATLQHHAGEKRKRGAD